MSIGQILRPRIQDLVMRQMNPLRPETVEGAQGDVLEIGFGTALNLELYGEDVRSLTGVDPMDVSDLKKVAERMAAAPFPVKFLQAVHGWTPGMIPLLMVVGGFLVFASMALAGTVADRIGRRRLAVGGLALNTVGLAIFYNMPGWWVVPGWILMTAGLVSVDVIFGALGSELFPTSYRSTASGLRTFAWTIGGSVGLFVEGNLILPLVDGHATALTWMLAGAWFSPLVILLFIPETASRELEDISPEAGAP